MTESKKILLFLMLCFNFVSGQSFQSIYLNSNDEIPLLSFDKPLDIDELLNEEIVKGQIFNFGKFVLCDINSDTKGSWTNVEDGKVWTLAIQAEEAKGISLYYDNFWIPSGGELYIYNPSQSQKIGPFTSKNNPASGVYATEIIYGDILILEYFQPNTTNNNLNLSINKFVYSYRDIISGQLGGYNFSENCQVNANCSEGNSWENQKKSVCRIQIGSGWNVGLCTGTLVNNTLNNCTPYVLSADHCFDGGDISENDLNQSIFYFNYLSPNCIDSVPNNTYSITGCSYVSNSGGEGSVGDPDFFLVELNSDPEFDPYFSGWDRSNTPASSGVSIHHPSGDIMKISTFTNSLSSSSGLGFGFDNTTHWQVQWSQTDNGHGVTEGGSSGSPIYNQNSLLVGVLTGGSSFCDATNQTDIYGKLWHGWDQVGNSNSEQLKPWLDPNNSDVLSLNGMFCSETQNTICIDSTLINPSCICPLIYDPVCGCDGELYSNACEATQCFGVASYVSAFDANGNLIDCSTFSFEGCTDSNADNYNANALIDDGSCSYCSEIANDIIIYDASSVLECNGAAISTPSGGFPPYTFNWNGNEGNNITTICSGNNVLTITDSIGCELVDTFFVGPVSLGCIDLNACNFSEIANTDDGSCIYPDTIYDCFGNCLNDNDFDGVCDELEIDGCTDENAPNYNMFATDDDGSCIECNISVEYILYNSSSNLECNGLIGLIINNQVDYIAYVNNEALNTNYYTEACFGQNEILIEDDLGCIYNDTLIVEANNIFGCTNPTALNYNPNANSHDGSCEYEELDSLCNITTQDILGPYFLEGAPITSVLAPEITGVPRLFITGTVYANDCSTTIPNILIDLWHANNEGYYEDENYRGKIYTDEYGSYSFESIKPGKYLNGSYYRPSHIHYKVEYLNSQELSTQLYFEGDSSLDIDPWSSDPSAVNRIIPLVLDEDSNLHGVFNIYLNIDSDECNCILVYGCTDPLAINYNSEATNDDNSCEYEELDNPCDFTPSELFVDNIIHNRVNFNWSQPEFSPSHYMIRYRPVGTSSWTVITAGPVNNNPFNGTSRTRYFMEPETTYEWNIRSRVLNDDGSTNCQSPWSASSQFTTLPACPNLENLSVFTEANWVTLNANAPGEEWGVWQSKAKMKELGTNSFRYANGDSYGNINVLKGNFSPNTEYQWHTKAWCTGNVDELGNSDPQYHSGWGDFSYFTTEEICDKMPINLSTSSNGANTAITMSWDLPLSGTPDHYFLELNNNNTGQQWQWNNISGSQTSKSKFGLTQGEFYEWRIRGACGTNGTSWATIFSEYVYYTLGGARLDNDIVSDLNVYPNPSRDLFNISFSSDELQSISIRVVNVIGEEIFKDRLTDFDGTYTHELDMSKKSKGVYFLEISSEKGTLNSKMVLQ